MTTRSMSPQRLRSPTLTFAAKKLSTSANGPKEGKASSFATVCAVFKLIGLLWFPGRLAPGLRLPVQ